jgi:hypothetical protein
MSSGPGLIPAQGRGAAQEVGEAEDAGALVGDGAAQGDEVAEHDLGGVARARVGVGAEGLVDDGAVAAVEGEDVLVGAADDGAGAEDPADGEGDAGDGGGEAREGRVVDDPQAAHLDDGGGLARGEGGGDRAAALQGELDGERVTGAGLVDAHAGEDRVALAESGDHVHAGVERLVGGGCSSVAGVAGPLSALIAGGELGALVGAKPQDLGSGGHDRASARLAARLGLKTARSSMWPS